MFQTTKAKNKNEIKKLPRFSCYYNEDERKSKTSEMRMLQITCGKTLKDKINNEKIREMTGVERLEEFLKEQRLQ